MKIRCSGKGPRASIAFRSATSFDASPSLFLLSQPLDIMVEEEPTKSEFTTWKSQDQNSGPPDLRLLHFNDVYHIEYAR